MFLHESEESPYAGQIKLPGSPRRRGGIALSTVVSVIKPLVEDKGPFELYDLSELEVQKRVILNLFRAIYGKYRLKWDGPNNVFLYASGFSAAIRFLQIKLLPFSVQKGATSQKVTLPNH
jgi:DNA sulfur modification protein DndB